MLESGVLSRFLGCWDEDFFGGPKVREFERNCEEYSGQACHHGQLWTSGLIAAVGAIGIEPGDEVIVTPWTMCASATAISNGMPSLFLLTLIRKRSVLIRFQSRPTLPLILQPLCQSISLGNQLIWMH